MEFEEKIENRKVIQASFHESEAVPSRLSHSKTNLPLKLKAEI